MTYGKIENDALVTAPRFLLIDGMKIWNATAEQYASLGYLPVIYTDAPETDAWHYAEYSWSQEEHCIRQTWTVVEIPEPSDDDELDDEQLGIVLTGGTL